jgi:hypothetical protein
MSQPHQYLSTIRFWTGLAIIALLPRIAAALLLDNPDGDAYSYVEAINHMRASLLAGTFSTKELAGFWLPMYQLICACISLVSGHSLYVAKVTSAILGAGSCLLVFSICRRVACSRTLAYSAFALAVASPLHIMYSGFSMTDVPFCFFVLASLLLTIANRPVFAAVCVAVAGLMRVEAWMLIILIPALQFLARRKIPLSSVALLGLAPAICFIAYQTATGNPLEYFDSRAAYIKELLILEPDLRVFSFSRMAGDAGRVLYSASPVVLIASSAAVVLLAKNFVSRGRKDISENLFPVTTICAFFFSFLAFLTIAYFTNNQPQIWTRYGLLLFLLGLPLLMWTISLARLTERKGNAETRLEGSALRAMAPRPWVAVVVVLGLVLQWGIQLHDGVAYAGRLLPQRPIVNYLRGQCRADPGIRIFSDDSTVRVLSDLPAATFVRSEDLPEDRHSFMAGLEQKQVRFLVYVTSKWSTPSVLFPELAQTQALGPFHPVMHQGTQREHSEVWLYKVEY